jgi:hypothetical protein
MMLDVFDADAFNLVNLTAALQKLPYKPGRIGELGLFENKPTSTKHAIIEEQHGKLSLLPTLPRGASNQTTQSSQRRKIRSFLVPHVPQWDALLADDLEGKRAFGSEDQVEIYSQIMNDRMEQMKQNHEITWEWHRIGALKGIVLDADGTTEVYDFFTEFGITQQEVSIDFADTGTYALPDPAVDFKVISSQIIRATQLALGDARFTGIHAMCGNQFFDSFIKHGTVRMAYERYQDNQFARQTQIPGGSQPTGFMFADIEWENYRGGIGTVDFFDSDKAYFFPKGVPQLFLEIPAPAPFVETVNTRGIPLYAKQERMKWDLGIELHTQSNVLFMCTRPKCLIKATGTNLVGHTSGLIS